MRYLTQSTRISRRRFLAWSGAVGAAPYVITSSALGAAGRAAASNRVTTALIGSGDRGLQIIEGGDTVLAVCDVDAKRRQAAKAKIDARVGNQDCKVYGDFRQVLARDDIDAVVVATPDHWHAAIAIAAIQAGKAVYIEKPMTLTIREGQQMCAAVRRFNGILQVGSQQRSLETFIKACELVRNGRLGQLKTIRAEIPARAGANNKPWKPQPAPPGLDYDSWLGPAPWAPYHVDRCHYNFRFVSDYSGGDVTNWGAHHLDIAQWAMGTDDSGPREIQGRGKRNPTGLHDAFYDVSVDFTYANGVVVQLRPFVGKGTGGVLFQGSEGSIWVSREKITSEPSSLLESRLGPNEIHLAPQAGATHMGIWLDSVRARSAKGVNVPVQIGHRSATVCHLANIAMELERKLSWDPVKEEFVDDAEANRLVSRPYRSPWRG